MYSIYADGVCFYNDIYVSDEYKVVSPKLKMADSAAGSLEVTLPPTNVGYDLLKRMKSTITVKRYDEEIWEGRITEDTYDFYNSRAVYCEGAIAYLNDTCQPQREYVEVTLDQFINSVLDIHNSKVNDNRKIYLDYQSVYAGVIEYRYTEYEQTMETINNVLTDFNCHMRMVKKDGKRYLQFFTEISDVSTQTVVFGKNLLDFSANFNMSDLATVILPIGAVKDNAGETKIGDAIDLSEANYNSDLDAGWFDGPGGTYKLFKPKTEGYFLTTQEEAENEIYIRGDFGSRHYLAQVLCPASYTDPNTHETTTVTVYISSRSYGGYGQYMWQSITNYHAGIYHVEEEHFSSSSGSTDAVEQAITVPPSNVAGTHYLLTVCSYGSDIQLRINTQTEVSPTLDSYYTAEDAMIVTGEPDPNKPNQPETKRYGNLYVTSASVNIFTSELENGELLDADGSVSDSWTGNRVITSDFIPITKARYILSGKALKVSADITKVAGVRTFVYDENGNFIKVYDNDGYKWLVLYSGTAAHAYNFNSDEYPEKMNLKFMFRFTDDSDINQFGLSELQLELATATQITSTPYNPPSSAMDEYGWIEKMITWDDVTDSATLYTRAKEYLTNGQFDKMSLTVSALDLGIIQNGTKKLEVMNKIRVISPPHGMDKYFDITELEIPLDDPENMQVKLGSESSSTLTGINNDTDNELLARIAATGSRSSIIQAAMTNADRVIKGVTTGYVINLVNTEGEDTGVPYATFWCDRNLKDQNPANWDAEDKAATGILINRGGIGFYGNGYDHKPTIVLVNESGQIVGDSILAESIIADRFRGGTMKLGWWKDSENKDVSGEIVVYSDKDQHAIAGVDLDHGFWYDGWVNDNSYDGWNRFIQISRGEITGGLGHHDDSDKKRYGRIQLGAVWAGGNVGISIEATDESGNGGPLNMTASQIDMNAENIHVARGGSVYTGFNGAVDYTYVSSWNSDGTASTWGTYKLNFVNGIFVGIS